LYELNIFVSGPGNFAFTVYQMGVQTEGLGDIAGRSEALQRNVAGSILDKVIAILN
jgi:hypothetical protein